MYRVMIVDDEQLIRITLKNMIDWEALDCSILALAKDGEEAWQLYQQAHPEIVITDLKMPKLDGIALIRRIKEENPNTQVIALSNHSDFELVKEAMKAGAFDYVLKVTLEEKELTSLIEEVKAHCVLEQAGVNSKYESIIEKLQHYMILCKNEHEIQPLQAQDFWDSPFFDGYRSGYQIAYFRVDNINLYYQSKSSAHDAIRRNLNDIMRETIPIFLTSQIIFISNHSGVILFHSIEKLRILNTCNSIMRNIHQYLDVQLSITLSPTSSDITSFFSLFKGVLERHEMRFYVGEGILIEAEELPTFNHLQMEEIDFHTQVLEAVSARDFSTMPRIDQAFMTYMKEQFIKPSEVLDYVIFILNNIEGNELARGIKTNFHFQEIVATLHQCETIDKLDEIMKEAFLQIEEWLNASSSNRYRRDITNIIAYVEENYHQKITLKDIARMFEISESYLSRSFKSETGKNLIYYVNEMKMKKARELLCNPKIIIKEAATAVGIDDQFYFNKLFKKFYGISPSEFCKRIKGKEHEQKENA